MKPSTISKVGYTLSAKYAKTIAKGEKQKVYSGVLCVTFFAFRIPFFTFHISQHFAPGSAIAQKVVGFCGINKTQKSCEIQKMYSECFVFRVMFRENIRKILVKYKKGIAGLRRLTSIL